MTVVRLLIRIYQLFVSPALTAGFDIRCRYEESCSRYMDRAIREQGLRKGVVSGLRRLMACNKWVHPSRSVHG